MFNEFTPPKHPESVTLNTVEELQAYSKRYSAQSQEEWERINAIRLSANHNSITKAHHWGLDRSADPEMTKVVDRLNLTFAGRVDGEASPRLSVEQAQSLNTAINRTLTFELRTMTIRQKIAQVGRVYSDVFVGKPPIAATTDPYLRVAIQFHMTRNLVKRSFQQKVKLFSRRLWYLFTQPQSMEHVETFGFPFMRRNAVAVEMTTKTPKSVPAPLSKTGTR